MSAWRSRWMDPGEPPEPIEIKCPTCGGRGVYHGEECPDCEYGLLTGEAAEKFIEQHNEDLLHRGHLDRLEDV